MSRRWLASIAVLALVPAGALADAGHRHGADTAYGKPEDPRQPARTVQVAMRETADGRMVFVPDRIAARRGEQIRFLLRNEGLLDHEMVIATLAETLRHAEAMRENPDMAHDDPNARRLAQKARRVILRRFTEPGTFDFSSLIPGRRESGMTGTFTVRWRRPPTSGPTPATCGCLP